MKNFMAGCNYWASNAGMLMWRHFDKKVVENDLKLLASFGTDTIRVFPLWCDFQPVEDTFTRAPTRMRMHGVPVTRKDVIDEKQSENFSFLLDTAEKLGLRVIVALLTGWMSGRLFAPAFLLGKNLLTDPEAIVWECGFIKAFVSRFKDRKCITAWEPGNECNCLDYSVNAAQAEHWLMCITNAIRAADATRPVYAGMHSLTCEGTWSIPVSAQYTDMQTTHPYPLFTPFCQTEQLTSMRAALHAAAESVYYASVARQKCLVEEIGTLGPMMIGEKYAPEYLEKAFTTSLQYGAAGFLWWCAFDQDRLDFAPYDAITVERNLGLVYSDGSPKPVLYRLKEVKERLRETGELPPPDVHAAVILSNGQDDWQTAYGAFVLAAQAGYTVAFSREEQELPESEYYILPCIAGTNGIPKTLLSALKARVNAGAKLLVTYDGGQIGDFESLTGLCVKGRTAQDKTVSFCVGGKTVSLRARYSLLCESAGAASLAENGDGVLFSRNKFGKGEVYFLNAPLECAYTQMHEPCESGLHAVYAEFLRGIERPLQVLSDRCAATYHKLSDRETAVFITSFEERGSAAFVLQEGSRIRESKFCKIEKGRIVFESAAAYIAVEHK